MGKKTHIETVVKCSINSIWACSDIDRDVLLDWINKLVCSVSQRTFNASIALNYLLCELFHDQNIEDVIVPEIDDQTFIRQMILKADAAQKPHSAVQHMYNTYPSFLPTTPRYYGDRNIYTHAAIKYKTNLVNHVVVNFTRFQSRYHKNLMKDHQWGDDDRLALLFGTNGWTTSSVIYPMRKEVSEMINYHRRVLGCETNTNISELWMKKNMKSCIKYFVLMLRYLERQDSERKFSIVPVCEIKTHFITLDRTTFENIIKHIFPNHGIHTLERWLDVSSIQGKRCTFSGTIDTDGVSACVHFKRPINNKQQEDVSLHIADRILAIDPGRISIYTIVEQQKDGTYIQTKFTKGQYYRSSGVYHNTKITKQWMKPFEGIWNDCSPKVIGLLSFQTYYERLKIHYDDLWKEKLRRRWGQQSFRVYGGKKRAFARFWKQYEDDKSTVVLYGSSKFAATGRGEVAAPVSRAFKEVKYRFPVKVVDEYRTTRIHHECMTDMKLVKSIKSSRPVHGLRWCCSPNCCKFVERDMNAAINILKCGTTDVRPDIFKRKGNITLSRTPLIGRTIYV